jgi:hypothetical protein
VRTRASEQHARSNRESAGVHGTGRRSTDNSRDGPRTTGDGFLSLADNVRSECVGL